MNNTFEWNVLVALFKATQEQQGMLIGQTQREAKMIFNRWMSEGDRLLKLIEQLSDEEALEELTSTIEDTIHELRKQCTK